MADIQWYPGHMAKTRRLIQEELKLVDLVIELADARIPVSSRNPDLDALCGSKARVLVLTKADLADPVWTQEYGDMFRAGGTEVITADVRKRQDILRIRSAAKALCAAKLERDRKRGIVGRPLRAMVCGIPNVGKSTFINSFVGRASAKTGNKPGVTRGKQWIRMDRELELLDTPGILWPKFDDRMVGVRLALTGSIREEILDKEDLARELILFLNSAYPGVLEEKYGGSDLISIAESRHLLSPGGGPDIFRTQNMLLDDMRDGRIGRITLDRPQPAEG